MDGSPLPSPELARRVGVLDQTDPVTSFDDLGHATKAFLVAFQPPGWFEGKRILDFGCGSGKLLRHLQAEAERCEIYGCDIHEPSIRWIRENLSPSFRVFTCGEVPPLDLPDGHLDLVWAMSVFTHLTDHWADWLLEIHRVLKPGGRFVATFLGEGMSESIADEPWDPDRIGMNVLRQWQDWDRGGPSVQHSEWWLRAHWGRLFEIEQIDDGPDFGHGVITLRRRDVALGREDLLADGGDPRERLSLVHNVRQVSREAGKLARECDALNVHRDSLQHEVSRLEREQQRLEHECQRLQATLERIGASRSWRLTGPLRALAARRRGVR